MGFEGEMREYCEEEMWVWIFPNHKCQKILSNHESKMSDLTSFGHEWFGKTHTYSHFRSHSIHIFLFYFSIFIVWYIVNKKLVSNLNCTKSQTFMYIFQAYAQLRGKNLQSSELLIWMFPSWAENQMFYSLVVFTLVYLLFDSYFFPS